MSPARRLRAGAGALALGLLVGCLGPAKPETETPDGPSETVELPSSAVIDAGMAEGADDAAKQAAAQEVLKKVKDRDPEEEKKKLARSKTVSAEARAKLQRGLGAEALLTAREALKIHEQNVDAMLVIAEAYYKQGKHELVYAVTTSALQVDAKIRTPEESSRAYNLQGFAMLGLGESTKATHAFKKAAEADEKNASAWNNLGTRYLEAGDVATAAGCFQYALELDPRFPEAQLNHGAALRAQAKWEEAEAAMRKALELRPSYAEAHFNLGVLYLDADPFPNLDTTQRLNKAIQSLGKYRELAAGDGTGRPAKTRGPGLGGDGKAPPPPVSKERADDYIRVAKKGLEREERRLEREKTKPGDAAGAGPSAGGEPATDQRPPDEPGTAPSEPTKPEPDEPGTAPSEPTKPAPQGPGTEPTKPAPQGPGTAPSEPAPQGPGTAPSEPTKPAPQGPSTPTPTKPAPQGPSTPTPTKPAPQGPSTPAPTPVQPAPQGPAAPTPTKPAPAPVQPAPAPVKPAPTPVQPAPQGPSTPAPTPVKPAPQQPGVQKPQSAALDLGFENLAPRGTRSIPPTLNPMAGPPARPLRARAARSSRGPLPASCIPVEPTPSSEVGCDAADPRCRSLVDRDCSMSVDPRRSLA